MTYLFIYKYALISTICELYIGIMDLGILRVCTGNVANCRYELKASLCVEIGREKFDDENWHFSIIDGITIVYHAIIHLFCKCFFFRQRVQLLHFRIIILADFRILS